MTRVAKITLTLFTLMAVIFADDDFQCPQFHAWGGPKTYYYGDDDFCSHGWWSDPVFPTCEDESDFTDIANVKIKGQGGQDCSFSFSTPPTDSHVSSCLDFAANGYNSQEEELWVVFVVHGFTGSFTETQWLIPMANSYINKYTKSNRRVVSIAVEWGQEELGRAYHPTCSSRYFTNFNYPRMASTTTVVGHLLATLMKEITARATNANNINTFCVGHSLGAHVCGFTGKSLRDTDGGPIVEGILGIDPAGPIFEDNDEDNKLWRGKAKMAQVLHTDRDQLGYRGDPGDVNFYFNGGNTQPDCFFSSLCSHNFAPPMVVKKNNDGERCLSTFGYEVGDLEDFDGPLAGGKYQYVDTDDSNGECHYEIL